MARGQGKTYEIDMCSGAILPKLLQFALPLMFSSILQLLFNAADIIVVGRWAGDNSLAAVGSNSSIIGLLTNLFIGLSVGANILAARFYGARGGGEPASDRPHRHFSQSPGRPVSDSGRRLWRPYHSGLDAVPAGGA